MTALGELASRMAHELRNPLTAIKMQLQLLEERTSEPERARIAGVLDEIRRLELIVNSSLAIGGAQALNPTPSDLDRLLDEVVTLVGPSLAHRGIDLQTAFADLPTVAVDGDRIKQVLLNLVNNAADELEGGGQILLAATPDGPHAVSIMVEDSGPGLPGEIERRRSGKSLGLGLGLQISREIVERHGGELLLGSSESLGGAKFTIRLPANIMTADGSEDR
ncbi:MAG: HAMP domain-containing sensor histidine kinase [Gammaproteobacteria bacterium]